MRQMLNCVGEGDEVCGRRCRVVWTVMEECGGIEGRQLSGVGEEGKEGC